MSECKETDLLKLLTKNYTFKKNPHIKKFYDEFNKGCKLGDNIGYYCSEIPEGKSINSNVKELYHKVQAIKTKAEMGENEELLSLNDYSTKGCTYLKYWLYDQIITIGFDETKTQELFDLWKEILQNNFELTLDYGLTCKFRIFELEDIKKIKLLLDYLLNYNLDKYYHDLYNIICTYGCNDCLNSIFDSYNNSDICQDEYSENFCKELHECINVYGISKLPKLRCERNKGSLIHPSESEDSITSQVYASGDTRETKSQHDVSPVESHVPQSEMELTNKSTTAIFSLVGTVLTFSCLYKFTPSGRWIREKILRRKSLRCKLDEEKNKFLEHSLQPDNVKLYNEERHLSYHPS
ncbi:VIR protein [Plasmodium vivax]|uniref:VIR protein n=1 Tax=Plasmodium vivax TaxID=5855 RepID=A0A1G4EDB8_PLAVI|nr:VIR protein [Plasmodium vivax]